MATYVPAKISTQFIFYVSLVSQANTKLMQVNPTIAAGDFKVSIDGAALANLGTLPAVTPAGSAMVKITLSTSEMAGANATVVCTDAAGAEWCDLTVNIPTAARQVDDLAFPATSGRSIVVDASGLADANMVKAGASGAGNTITTSGGVTLPAATVASTTNITAGTITTATNLTNAATAGDFTATMKTSIGTAVAASAVASVTGAVGSVTAGVSVGVGGIASTSFAAAAIDAAAIATDAIGSAELAAGAVTKITAGNFAFAFPAAYNSLTFAQLTELMSAALLAKCSGMATATGVFRNLADSADTITATIDASGNRTAVTLVP